MHCNEAAVQSEKWAPLQFENKDGDNNKDGRVRKTGQRFGSLLFSTEVNCSLITAFVQRKITGQSYDPYIVI